MPLVTNEVRDWVKAINHAPETTAAYEVMDMVDAACDGKPLDELVTLALSEAQADLVQNAILDAEHEGN